MQAPFSIINFSEQNCDGFLANVFILGAYFMPYIGLPVYYVMHIWRDGSKPAVEAPAPGAAG